MSTDGSSMDWSDLFDSQPMSCSSEETRTTHLSSSDTQEMAQLTEQMSSSVQASSLEDLSDKLPENLNLKDTYVIYSVGNTTLCLSSLDPQYATESQLQLLDRHLLDVKIAHPEQPLWPNPDILTLGMRNIFDVDEDVPSTSSAAATAAVPTSTPSRRCHTKMKCVKQLGKKRRAKQHHKF
ncbi:hypothetical protein AWZ03_011750 [Drosophila navojoa]|uniref:Uncharacterized protein n=1 Tax=Drosophila navojoa TaxID=7232 RepID=A0A484B215_DRONA|nr:hypothetical protein AWZ03_011750 [Drosophila navojoa]